VQKFCSDEKLVGLGYLIQGVNYDAKNSKFQSIFRPRAANYGQLTSSGKNFWYPEKTINPQKQPMWIPGCAMSFRKSEIINQNFNSNLERGVLGGYALGEDVDFTLRLFNNGAKLELCVDLIINHLIAPGERDNQKIFAKAQGEWLRYLAMNYPSNVKLSSMVFRLMMENCYITLAVILRRTSWNAARLIFRKTLSFLKPSPYPTSF
jgi:GT2 family glycosyltransferase